MSDYFFLRDRGKKDKCNSIFSNYQRTFWQNAMCSFYYYRNNDGFCSFSKEKRSFFEWQQYLVGATCPFGEKEKRIIFFNFLRSSIKTSCCFDRICSIN